MLHAIFYRWLAFDGLPGPCIPFQEKTYGLTAARKALWIFFVFAVLLGVSAGGSPLSIHGAFTGAASAAAQVRLPLIIIPGMGGSRMENDPDLNGVYGEVWPNGDRLVLDPWDKTLLQLKLAPDGSNPFSAAPAYATVRVGDIIRKEYFLDYYASTIAYFTAQGYVEGRDLFVCPYDWRKDVTALAAGPLAQTLAKCVDNALARNPGAGRVNLLAHSMGGLVARRYLADPAQAAKVQRLVTLGTPVLGTPKIALAIIDKLCFADGLGLCFSNPDVLHELIQDFPAGYEIAPGAPYFQLYPAGYLRRDWDADGDGRRDGALSPAASDNMLAVHNPYLMEQAHILWAQFGPWSPQASGPEIYAIAGDQHASIGTIVEAQTHPWYNPWGAGVLRYRTEVTNGDGTVPLHSADLRDRARGIDLSGQVPTYYFNLEHGDLPKDPNVLALANAIFARGRRLANRGPGARIGRPHHAPSFKWPVADSGWPGGGRSVRRPGRPPGPAAGCPA